MYLGQLLSLETTEYFAILYSQVEFTTLQFLNLEILPWLLGDHLTRCGQTTPSQQPQTKGPYRAPSAFKEGNMGKQREKKAPATPDKFFVSTTKVSRAEPDLPNTMNAYSTLSVT
jgi:hypothetical protein